MGSVSSFNIESALNNWVSQNCSANDMTPADINNMKEHMMLMVQDLIDEKKLSEEEAFAVAKIRFGGKDDWSEEMQTVNENNFRLKKIIILFGGIFVFLFANYFILCLDKLLFLTLNYFNGVIEENVVVSRYLFKTIYLLTIFLFVAAFYMHSPLIWIMNKFSFRPTFVVIFILFTFGLVILDWYLVTKVSGSVKDIGIKNVIFFMERNFKNFFLLICGLGYIALFLRYYKKFMK